MVEVIEIPANDKIPFHFSFKDIKKGDRIINIYERTKYDKRGSPFTQKRATIYTVTDIDTRDIENKKIEVYQWFASIFPRSIREQKSSNWVSHQNEHDMCWIVRGGKFRGLPRLFNFVSSQEFDELDD